MGRNREVPSARIKRNVAGRQGKNSASLIRKQIKRRRDLLPPFFFARFLLDSAAILY